MKHLTADQIREKFLDFFTEKGHLAAPSFPVVPINDNSLLLINAGMTPLKPYFTGQQQPPAPRMATCQKCIRTSDIDEVGKTERHGSFFEMLGNFSFGDYFKKEIIPWAWEFAVQIMEMPIDKLYVSVYHEDDEAYAIWRDTVGVPPERIIRLGKKDNFWEHGVGPCGPCSELHFDRGAQAGCGKADCTVGCDCDRFMEFWNLVFIQFNKNEDGTYTPLPAPSIDTGMGLDRMAMLMQGVQTIFEIDTAKAIRDKIRALAGLSGTETDTQRVAVNIIADHVRCVTIMASDGVRPGSAGRDYVLRRLLRRAVRFARNLGLTHCVAETAQTVIDMYKRHYPNLEEKSAHILQLLSAEEARFLETLETGLALLERHIDTLKKASQEVLDGADAFKLYDTFGFPPDITREILEENGLRFDQSGFDAHMEKQRDTARTARGESTYMGADETIYHKLPPGLPTVFTGYAPNGPAPAAYRANPAADAEVLALVADGEATPEAREGQEVGLVLSRTPFYAASGGQAGDIGIIKGTTPSDWAVAVTDCIKAAGDNTVHLGTVLSGTPRVGAAARTVINHPNRFAAARNHTATHILHKALREIVGPHVEQAGSEVTPERLRFDFTHHGPLTPEERGQLEEQVNAIILGAYRVHTLECTPEEARKAGAVALFGEKYGDKVRMVTIDGACNNKESTAYSVELCGGTHVGNTSEIGTFKLLSESGIAAGVRRIEAATGERALSVYREAASRIAALAEQLKAPPAELNQRVATLAAENRELKKTAAKQQEQAAKGELELVVKKIFNESVLYINGLALITAALPGYDIETLRTLGDKLKAAPAFTQNGGCFLLAGISGEAVQFLASATDNAVKAGLHAGQIVKAAAQLCGGNGGGRPNHAQAGGKDAAQAQAALAAGLELMKSQLAI